ncbi:MAG: hypothetical protein ACRD4S_08300 [Candidatus Acidiferrales bacterium]
MACGLQGVKPIEIPQAIASGLLGMKSFSGGASTAALGVVLHFFIAFSAAAVYYVASRKLTFMVRRAVACGLLYGACVYIFMHVVVLPLSAEPKFPHHYASMACEFVEHLFLVGLPISLAVRRYSK